MAREYAREEESRFCLVLDTTLDRASSPEAAEQFERAVSFAASLAVHFAGEGAELEFLSPRDYVPLGIGTDHLYRILRALAVLQCDIAAPSAPCDIRAEFCGSLDPKTVDEVLSGKSFKIIITPKPKGSFPSTIWRSSHIVYFNEL
jgi:uncharacterized protein (DUF58 family)